MATKIFIAVSVIGIWLLSASPLAMAAPVQEPRPITFTKDVLPILQKNCQGCHRPGQIAPMPLLNGDSLAVSSASTWGWILFMVALPGSGHFLMNWAHEYVPLTVTSLLTLSTPVIAAVGAALVLHEPLLLMQAVGMAVVLIGLGVVVRRRSRSQSADGGGLERVVLSEEPLEPGLVDAVHDPAGLVLIPDALGQRERRRDDEGRLVRGVGRTGG